MSCSKIREDVLTAFLHARACFQGVRPLNVAPPGGAAIRMLTDMNQSSALRHHTCGLLRASQVLDACSSGTRHPLLVEFLGTPGSGKTTICAAVVSELSRDGFAVITREDYFAWMYGPRHKKLEYMLAGGFKTLYFAAYLTYFLWRTSRRRGGSLFKATYELVCMQAWLSTIMRRSARGPIILDEFACNRFVYRLYDSPLTAWSRSNLVRLLLLFYPRCSVHWILKTVPIGIAAQRIVRRPLLNNRAPKPIETLPAARGRAALIQHMQLSQFIFDAIQSRFGAHAYVVDGAEPVDAQVRNTRDILVGLLSDGGTTKYANP